MFHPWTHEEDAILTECLVERKMSMREANQYLPNRTYTAIKTHASVVGLKSYHAVHRKRGAGSDTFKQNVLAQREIPWPKKEANPLAHMKNFHDRHGYFQDIGEKRHAAE